MLKYLEAIRKQIITIKYKECYKSGENKDACENPGVFLGSSPGFSILARFSRVTLG